MARLGGDEFAVLVTGTLGEAVEVAQRVVDVLALPHRVRRLDLRRRRLASGSPSCAPGGGQLAFREADDALRAAKQAGKGCVRLADQDVPSLVPDGLDLATVLAEGAFSVRFDAACDADGRLDVVHGVPVWDAPRPRHGPRPGPVGRRRAAGPVRRAAALAAAHGPASTSPACPTSGSRSRSACPPGT